MQTLRTYTTATSTKHNSATCDTTELRHRGHTVDQHHGALTSPRGPAHQPPQLRRETHNEMFWKNRVIHDQTGHRMIQPINRTFSRQTQHLSSTTSEGDLSKTRLVLGGSVRDLTLHYYYYKTQRSPKGGDSSTTTICAPTTLTTLTRSLLDFIIKQILLRF